MQSWVPGLHRPKVPWEAPSYVGGIYCPGNKKEITRNSCREREWVAKVEMVKSLRKLKLSHMQELFPLLLVPLGSLAGAEGE